MANATVLKQLFPVHLGPTHAADCEVEGAALDAVELRLSDLLKEAFPDTALETLSYWERVYGIIAPSTANTSSRRAAIITAMRATGGLSRAYFIALAAKLGYAITIIEPTPAYCGIAHCGDRLYVDGIIFCWQVNGALIAASHHAYCGQAVCGDRLSSFQENDLLTLFNRLKPAHTCVFLGDY